MFVLLVVILVWIALRSGRHSRNDRRPRRWKPLRIACLAPSIQTQRFEMQMWLQRSCLDPPERAILKDTGSTIVLDALAMDTERAWTALGPRSVFARGVHVERGTLTTCFAESLRAWSDAGGDPWSRIGFPCLPIWRRVARRAGF
jgi:hypothetical protein